MTRLIDAYHLPLLDDGEITGFAGRTLDGGRFTVRTPQLIPGAITRYAARLRAARQRVIGSRTADDTARTLAAAAATLTSGPTRELILAALPDATGFSPAMARHVLDGMAVDWTLDALRALIAAELGDGALDGFVPHAGGRVRAVGAPLIVHVFAGNVPGVPVTSLMRASLVGSATLAKTAAGEPLLAPLFARAVHALDPALGACHAVTWWPGGETATEHEALAAADLAVVYGGGATVASIRQRAPARLTIVEHGPKISFGIVGAAALEDEHSASATAAAVADAVAAFDQHGCVSPQIVYVERGAAVTPRAFAALVARSLTVAAAALPRGRLLHADAGALREVAARAEFRATAGVDVALFDAADGMVVYDGVETDFEGSCLNRAVRIKAVDRAADVPSLVAPFRDILQSAALAGFADEARERLAGELAHAGVTRITTFPRLPWPPATWHHDGRGPLTELLRFVDLES